MNYTSAEANKLLKALQEELHTLCDTEDLSKEFLAAVNENAEELRPVYDFKKTQASIDALEKKIRTVKHAINVFNTTTKIEALQGATIDQVLVLLPQLSLRKDKLANMLRKLPKVRENNFGRTAGNIIDYRYINYDLQEVKKEYEKVSSLLDLAQTELDKVNGTVTMEIKI